MTEMNRRSFLAGAGAAVAASHPAIASELLTPPESAKKPTIGIQIGSISFQDEGTEKVLDNLQEKGACNALFIATWTYGNGIAGRQLPGHPFPDHGIQAEDHFFGGFYTQPHEQYYKNLPVKSSKAPDS